jgi:hypothetical protein
MLGIVELAACGGSINAQHVRLPMGGKCVYLHQSLGQAYILAVCFEDLRQSEVVLISERVVLVQPPVASSRCSQSWGCTR